MGRYRLTSGSLVVTRAPRISRSGSATTYDELAAYAEHRGLPVSTVVRMLVFQAIAPADDLKSAWTGWRAIWPQCDAGLSAPEAGEAAVMQMAPVSSSPMEPTVYQRRDLLRARNAAPSEMSLWPA